MTIPLHPGRPGVGQWDSAWPLSQCRPDLLWRLRLMVLEGVIEAAWVHGDRVYVAFPGRHPQPCALRLKLFGVASAPTAPRLRRHWSITRTTLSYELYEYDTRLEAGARPYEN